MSENAFYGQLKNIEQKSRTPQPTPHVVDRSTDMLVDLALNTAFKIYKDVRGMYRQDVAQENERVKRTSETGTMYLARFNDEIAPSLKKNFWLDPIGTTMMRAEAPRTAAEIESRHQEQQYRQGVQEELQLARMARENTNKIGALNEKLALMDMMEEPTSARGWNAWEKNFNAIEKGISEQQPVSDAFSQSSSAIANVKELQSRAEGTIADPVQQSQIVNEYAQQTATAVIQNLGTTPTSAATIQREISKAAQNLPDNAMGKEAHKQIIADVVGSISDLGVARNVLDKNSAVLDSTDKKLIENTVTRNVSLNPYITEKIKSDYQLNVDRYQLAGTYFKNLRKELATPVQILHNDLLLEHDFKAMSPTEIKKLANVQKNIELQTRLENMANQKAVDYEKDFPNTARKNGLMTKYGYPTMDIVVPVNRDANGDFDPEEMVKFAQSAAATREVFDAVRNDLKNDPLITNMVSAARLKQAREAYDGYHKSTSRDGSDFEKRPSQPKQKWALATTLQSGLDYRYSDANGRTIFGADPLNTSTLTGKIYNDPSLPVFLKTEKDIPGAGEDLFKIYDANRQQHSGSMAAISDNFEKYLGTTMLKINPQFTQKDIHEMALLATAGHSGGLDFKSAATSPGKISHQGANQSSNIRPWIDAKEFHFFGGPSYDTIILPGKKIMDNANDALQKTLKTTKFDNKFSMYDFLNKDYETHLKKAPHPTLGKIVDKKIYNYGGSLTHFVIKYQYEKQRDTDTWNTLESAPNTPVVITLPAK